MLRPWQLSPKVPRVSSDAEKTWAKKPAFSSLLLSVLPIPEHAEQAGLRADLAERSKLPLQQLLPLIARGSGFSHIFPFVQCVERLGGHP